MNKQLDNTYINTGSLSPSELTKLYKKYSEASGVDCDRKGGFCCTWFYIFINNGELKYYDSLPEDSQLRVITEQDLDNYLKESEEFAWKSRLSECTCVGTNSTGDIIVELNNEYVVIPQTTLRLLRRLSQEDIEREELYNTTLESFLEISGLLCDDVIIERMKGYSDLMYDKGVRLTTNKETN